MTGWIYCADGRVIEKGSPAHDAYLGEQAGGPLVFADEGEFRSPIDNKVYSGKLGMREHNARHNVINNRDLAGLPTGVDPNRKTPPTTRERQQLRQDIYTSALRKGYLEGQ